MKIHEYQAKEILRQYGIPVPVGRVVTTPFEAELAAFELGTPAMVKAQIQAGGRGKGGGVKTAFTPNQAQFIASQILGRRLRTSQTSPDGMLVTKLLIEKRLDIKKEFYLGIIVDRQRACPVIIMSGAGGMSIEEIAQKYPEKIHKTYIDPLVGYKGREGSIIPKLYRLFKEKDCLLVEINPLVVTQDNQFFASDAKMVFDDDALFRHPEIRELADPLMEDPLEAEAKKAGINYVRLEGDIGCMVNGAGLAMATMDAIKFFGGSPANFLDVGGGASPEKIKTAFQILISDSSVKAVFINILGGISRGDFLAEGLLAVYRERQLSLPLVLRLDGTNAREGLKMLKRGGVKFFKVSGLSQGAKKAIELADRGGRR